MPILVESIPRVFKYGDKVLEDPDPNMTVDDVMLFYADTYPDIIISKAVYKGIENEHQIYDINVNPGTKG